MPFMAAPKPKLQKFEKAVLFILAFLCSPALMHSSDSVWSSAANERITVSEDGFVYHKESDTTCKIIGVQDGTMHDVNIPSKIDGLDVTIIGEKAFYGTPVSGNLVI